MAENPPETVSFTSQPSPSHPSSSSSLKSPQDPPQVGFTIHFNSNSVHSLGPELSNFPQFPDGYYQMFPGMHPALIPGLTQPQIEEHRNRGAGIYVVPVNPFDIHVIGLPYTKILIANYAKNNDPNFELLSSTSQGFFPYDFCIICIRCFRFFGCCRCNCYSFKVSIPLNFLAAMIEYVDTKASSTDNVH
ncbi:hypothetical protein RYX36_001605 [Vicia faba]